MVIFSGEGKAFCTGLDAKSVALSGPSASLRRLLERPFVLEALAELEMLHNAPAMSI